MNDKLSSSIKNEFERWLALDLNSMTNEGRMQNSFDQFWEKVFIADKNFLDIFNHLTELTNSIKSGPLYSWLEWLKKKFLIFTLHHTNLSIKDFCEKFQVDESYLVFILRDHLYQLYPLEEEIINDSLSLGNLTSDKRLLTLRDILKLIKGEDISLTGVDDEMMTSLEVVLFPSWSELMKIINKEKIIPDISLSDLQRVFHWRGLLYISREIAIILVISAGLIWVTKQGNQWYERFIANKIQIFEPSYLGIDKTLTYRPDDKEQRKIELSNKEIELLEKIESAKTLEDIPETRFDPESDEVVLTSVEEIPKDFNQNNEAPSAFEEGDKGGFRDMTANRGGRKAYRALMTSVSPHEIKNKIMPLLEEYKVVQKDNVKPGTEIPGGIYFNLLVPTPKLKEFLGRINSIQETTLFESTPRESTPAGKNKVFIWIKSI
jgi:hypothetical protein